MDRVEENKDAEPFECLALKEVNALVKDVKRTVERLPDGFDAWQSFPIALAEVRHEYTNYDDVLFRLPRIGVAGLQYPDDLPRYCPCPFEVDCGDCEHQRNAYLEIKYRANDIAFELIHEHQVRNET